MTEKPWLSVDDEPDWSGGGKAELRTKTGTVVTGFLWPDAGTAKDGEEYPIWRVTLDADDSETSFYDFAQWRLMQTK